MPRISNAQYRETARTLYANRAGHEIDTNAVVSRGDDPGAYVHAWVWVTHHEILARLTPAQGQRIRAGGTPTAAHYRKTAKALYHHDGEVEIDANAVISYGDDPGAYVQAWVWVDNVAVRAALAEQRAKAASRATTLPAAVAIEAIRARLNGVFDHPALQYLGPLLPNTTEDIRRILAMVPTTPFSPRRTH